MLTKTTFHYYDRATIAAIEYLIQRYGNEYWFNYKLASLMNELYSKPPHQTFIKGNGLTIYYDIETGEIKNYNGYHYLIEEMIKYGEIMSINVYIYWMKLILNLISILLCIYIYYFIGYNSLVYNQKDVP